MGRMPRGPNSPKANVRAGRSLTAYSIRSSSVSKAGSGDSFQVFVRWKVIPGGPVSTAVPHGRSERSVDVAA